MLAAARQNVPTNTVYLDRYSYGASVRDLLREPSRTDDLLRARRDEYCKQEIERARSGGRLGGASLFLHD
jgi:hypothetical protein